MLAATAAARNLFFMQTPGASQIMLRNHQSAIFCRRTFARETYFYQPVMPGVACSDKGTPFNAALRISFFSIYLYLSLSLLLCLCSFPYITTAALEKLERDSRRLLEQDSLGATSI
jgi:hypothetical protein